jgi:hypothetical protein
MRRTRGRGDGAHRAARCYLKDETRVEAGGWLGGVRAAGCDPGGARRSLSEHQ